MGVISGLVARVLPHGTKSEAHRGALLRAIFSAVAMVVSAGWFVALRDRAADASGSADTLLRSDVLRWWAVAHLTALSVVLALAAAMLRESQPSERLARASMPLELGVVLAWIQLTGSASSPVVTLAPLLVVSHRAFLGPRWGAMSFALASTALAGSAMLEAAGALPYASLWGRAEGAPPPWHRAAVGLEVLACAGALGLGALVARAPSSRRTASARDGAAADSGGAEPPLEGRQSGRTIDGRYRLGELIGRGGMGAVYSAVRKIDGRRVALKLLHAHLTDVPLVIERFRREVNAVAKLPPARVVPPLDVGVSPEGHHYLVMDLLLGEDLAQRLSRAPRLSVRETVVLVAQIAEALDAAAELGIVHRDVKPRNIFLVGEPGGVVDARLLDFGICRLLDVALAPAAHRTAALLGTPGYLAPEQVAESFGEVGPQTDVFALGAVAYRALTGESAFPSRQPAVAAYEALNHHPAPAHQLRDELTEDVGLVLALALAKDPKQRYGRASELARDLAAAADGRLPPAARERARALVAHHAARSSTITSAA